MPDQQEKQNESKSIGKENLSKLQNHQAQRQRPRDLR